MMFSYPNSRCRELMALQVTQCADDPLAPWKLAVREAALYCEWLPPAPKRVLDLGCGLGRTTVMLHWLYGSPRGTIYDLADGTRIDSPLVGGWRPDRDEWCNDRRETLRFCRANMRGGLLVDRDLLAGSPWTGAREPVVYDLVVSTLAVGFHWAIEPWLDRLGPMCRDGTVLIFGVRRGMYKADYRPPAGWRRIGFARSQWKEDFLALRVTPAEKTKV